MLDEYGRGWMAEGLSFLCKDLMAVGQVLMTDEGVVVRMDGCLFEVRD